MSLITHIVHIFENTLYNHKLKYISISISIKSDVQYIRMYNPPRMFWKKSVGSEH